MNTLENLVILRSSYVLNCFIFNFIIHRYFTFLTFLSYIILNIWYTLMQDLYFFISFLFTTVLLYANPIHNYLVKEQARVTRNTPLWNVILQRICLKGRRKRAIYQTKINSMYTITRLLVKSGTTDFVIYVCMKQRYHMHVRCPLLCNERS